MYIYTYIGIIIILKTFIDFLLSLDKYRFYMHEYGHVLEIIKDLYVNIDEYKKHITKNTIIIKVCTLHKVELTVKKKTYCEYLKYISTETNKKNTRYIEAIKNIAIGGLKLNKEFIKYKLFYLKLLYKTFLFPRFIIISITTSSIIYNCINFFLFKLRLNPIIIIIWLLFSILGNILWYIINMYRAYGFRKCPKKGKKNTTDKQNFHHPENFNYTDLEDDKNDLNPTKIKTLLEIEIDINNIKTPTIKNSDKLYTFIIKEILLTSYIKDKTKI